ncbi:hypothetical protein HYALB_00003028 [Hymenoscyphus albidus]|uniref:Cell surface spherulin 4-like protein n=1 Tax=Hymenoscyphus albidus TaxID=595503 RepID=A0A9N9LV84_9HELO|nr:hypothetical protein HYALB_00003028 [Hymenoscyphus albidus]
MVNALQILFPLYLYPTPGAWDPLYSSITAHPNVEFNVIINPNSGPGTSLDASYTESIAKLNSYNNTKLFGYVRTDYTNQPYAQVTADVSTYANWPKTTPADVHMDGIFFDEAVQFINQASGDYMRGITNFAKSAFNNNAAVIFNPGTNTSPEFYDIADIIVPVEAAYSSYSAQTTAGIPAAERSKAAVLLHHFTGSLTDQKNVVNAMANSGVGYLFLTDQEYNSFSSIYSQFAADVASTPR